jgi:transposase
MAAVATIDSDMRCMATAPAACRRLMTFSGVGQLTAIAFVATIDDPSRICDSRDIGAYLGWFQDAIGPEGSTTSAASRSAAGADASIRGWQRHADRNTGRLKLEDWAFGIANRSTIRKARIAPARRRAIIARTMPRDGTEFVLA